MKKIIKLNVLSLMITFVPVEGMHLENLFNLAYGSSSKSCFKLPASYQENEKTTKNHSVPKDHKSDKAYTGKTTVCDNIEETVQRFCDFLVTSKGAGIGRGLDWDPETIANMTEHRDLVGFKYSEAVAEKLKDSLAFVQEGMAVLQLPDKVKDIGDYIENLHRILANTDGSRKNLSFADSNSLDQCKFQIEQLEKIQKAIDEAKSFVNHLLYDGGPQSGVDARFYRLIQKEFGSTSINKESINKIEINFKKQTAAFEQLKKFYEISRKEVELQLMFKPINNSNSEPLFKLRNVKQKPSTIKGLEEFIKNLTLLSQKNIKLYNKLIEDFLNFKQSGYPEELKNLVSRIDDILGTKTFTFEEVGLKSDDGTIKGMQNVLESLKKNHDTELNNAWMLLKKIATSRTVEEFEANYNSSLAPIEAALKTEKGRNNPDLLKMWNDVSGVIDVLVSNCRGKDFSTKFMRALTILDLGVECLKSGDKIDLASIGERVTQVSNAFKDMNMDLNLNKDPISILLKTYVDGLTLEKELIDAKYNKLVLETKGPGPEESGKSKIDISKLSFTQIGQLTRERTESILKEDGVNAELFKFTLDKDDGGARVILAIANARPEGIKKYQTGINKKLDETVIEVCKKFKEKYDIYENNHRDWLRTKIGGEPRAPEIPDLGLSEDEKDILDPNRVYLRCVNGIFRAVENETKKKLKNVKNEELAKRMKAKADANMRRAEKLRNRTDDVSGLRSLVTGNSDLFTDPEFLGRIKDYLWPFAHLIEKDYLSALTKKYHIAESLSTDANYINAKKEELNKQIKDLEDSKWDGSLSIEQKGTISNKISELQLYIKNSGKLADSIKQRMLYEGQLQQKTQTRDKLEEQLIQEWQKDLSGTDQATVKSKLNGVWQQFALSRTSLKNKMLKKEEWINQIKDELKGFLESKWKELASEKYSSLSKNTIRIINDVSNNEFEIKQLNTNIEESSKIIASVMPLLNEVEEKIINALYKKMFKGIDPKLEEFGYKKNSKTTTDKNLYEEYLERELKSPIVDVALNKLLLIKNL